MIDDAFARTGLTIVNPRPCTRLQVFGERASGTNFVRRLLGRNTSLQPTDALGWKHGFPAMVAIPQDCAVICVVRDPRDWVLSMHARPWHCPPEMQRLGFSDFLRAEWLTVADRARYFPGLDTLGAVGQPLQFDRDPATGRPFVNIAALRTAKLKGLFSFKARSCTAIFTRLEAVREAPEWFVREVCTALHAVPNEPFRPVVRRLGTRFKPAAEPRPETPARLPDQDAAWLARTLDPDIERALGYDIASG